MADQDVLPLAYGEQSQDPIYNREVATIIDFLDDYVRQLSACPSASEREWKEADIQIAREGYNYCQSLISEANSEPEQ